MKKYIVSSKKYFLLGLIVSVMTALLSVVLSFSMGNFVTSAAEVNFKGLIINGSLSIFSIVLQLGTYSLSTKYKNKFVKECIIKIKMDLTYQLLNNYLFDIKEEHIFLIENKVPQLANDYLSPIFSIYSLMIQVILTGVGLLWLDIRLFLIFTGVSVFPLIINPLLKKQIGNYKKEFLDETGNSHKMTRELLHSFLELRLMDSIPFVLPRMRESIEKIEKLREKTNTWDYLINRIAIAIGMLAQMICMLVAAIFIFLRIIPVGGLTTATQLSNYIFPAINMINAQLLLIKTSQEIVFEIQTILNNDDSADVSNTLDNYDVTIENVSLEYPNKTISYPSYTFLENKYYLLVGESGAGKSSLFKLLLKELQHSTGSIKVGNVCLDQISKRQLFTFIGYMPQDIKLFTATLEENIALFNENILTRERHQINKLIDYFELQHLKHKILSIEEISGGERQRIGLIRLLIQKKKIVLLDEPVSALDIEMRKKVLVKINEMLGTKLLISHVYNENDGYDEIITIERLGRQR